MPRSYGVLQLNIEMRSLVFARVVRVQVHHKVDPADPVDEDAPVEHFYGFAKDLVTGASIWFKRATHARFAGRPGMFVGPVALRHTCGTVKDLPRRGSVVVGRTVEAARGTAFEWWMHRAEPVLALARAAETGRFPHYESLAVDDDAHPDGMWALARVLLLGDVATVVDQLRPRPPYHPVHRDGYRRKRGLRFEYDVDDFLRCAAAFVQQPRIAEDAHAYAGRVGVQVDVAAKKGEASV